MSHSFLISGDLSVRVSEADSFEFLTKSETIADVMFRMSVWLVCSLAGRPSICVSPLWSIWYRSLQVSSFTMGGGGVSDGAAGLWLTNGMIWLLVWTSLGKLCVSWFWAMQVSWVVGNFLTLSSSERL